jgi:hypothetical protein
MDLTVLIPQGNNPQTALNNGWVRPTEGLGSIVMKVISTVNRKLALSRSIP